MSLLSGVVPRIFDGCPSYLSSPQPPSRDPPSKRHINVKQRKEAEQQEWLKCDKIDSYERFSSDVKVHIQSSFPSVFVHQSEDHVLLYKLNHSDDTSRSVSVSLTIRIYKNMTFSVDKQHKGVTKYIDWILSYTKSSLQLWSQLHNIVSRYSIDTPDVDVTSSSSKALAHNVESFGVTIKREETCNFLAEQIRLLTTAAKGRRYSIDMLIYAFNLYHESPACYEEVRKVLCLPSKHLI